MDTLVSFPFQYSWQPIILKLRFFEQVGILFEKPSVSAILLWHFLTSWQYKRLRNLCSFMLSMISTIPLKVFKLTTGICLVFGFGLSGHDKDAMGLKILWHILSVSLGIFTDSSHKGYSFCRMSHWKTNESPWSEILSVLQAENLWLGMIRIRENESEGWSRHDITIYWHFKSQKIDWMELTYLCWIYIWIDA